MTREESLIKKTRLIFKVEVLVLFGYSAVTLLDYIFPISPFYTPSGRLLGINLFVIILLGVVTFLGRNKRFYSISAHGFITILFLVVVFSPILRKLNNDPIESETFDINLFYTIALGVMAFYFLGIKRGIYWTFILLSIVPLFVILDFADLIPFPFQPSIAGAFVITHIYSMFFIHSFEKQNIAQFQALEEINSRTKSFLMAIGNGLVIIDEDMNVILVNKVFERMVSNEENAIIQTHIENVFLIENEHGDTIPIRDLMDHMKPMPGKRTLFDEDIPYIHISPPPSYFLVPIVGKKIPVQVSVAPILDKDLWGGYVLVIRDVTEEMKKGN